MHTMLMVSESLQKTAIHNNGYAFGKYSGRKEYPETKQYNYCESLIQRGANCS